MNYLYKPYTNKAYADFVIENQGKNICQDHEKIWFEDYPIIEPTYAEQRLENYPAINDQLDMIYWDKLNNTNLWEELITNIKTQYPK